MPVKVKSPFQACALLLDSVIAAAVVLSIVVPPEIVNVPVPSAVALLMSASPVFSVSPPWNVFAPESWSAPPPVFVRPFAPLITPAIETVLPFVSIVPVADATLTARVAGEVIVPLACNVPPEKISWLLALPSAEVEFTFSVPAEIVVLPVYVFAPVRVSVPPPAFVRPKPTPPMTPPTVSVLADTVTWREALIETAPVPRFRAFEPANVKSPLQVCG